MNSPLSLHYITLHYTTLHYTPLHSTPLHYTTLPYTPLHYNTLHFTTLDYTRLHFTTLDYTTLHPFTLHLTSLPCTTLQSSTTSLLLASHLPPHQFARPCHCPCPLLDSRDTYLGLRGASKQQPSLELGSWGRHTSGNAAPIWTVYKKRGGLRLKGSD